jgi:hypothetical protein
MRINQRCEERRHDGADYQRKRNKELGVEWLEKLSAAKSKRDYYYVV